MCLFLCPNRTLNYSIYTKTIKHLKLYSFLVYLLYSFNNSSKLLPSLYFIFSNKMQLWVHGNFATVSGKIRIYFNLLFICLFQQLVAKLNLFLSCPTSMNIFYIFTTKCIIFSFWILSSKCFTTMFANF